MAKIKYDDLFDSNLDDEIKSLKSVIKALTKANEQLANSYKPTKKATDDLTESTKKLNGATKAGRDQNKKNANSASEMAEKVILAKKAQEEFGKLLLQTTDALKRAEGNEKRLKIAMEATNATTDKGIAKRLSLNKQLEKNTVVIQKLRKAAEEEKKTVDGLNGSYNQLQKTHKKSVAQWRKLTAAERESTTVGKQLTAQIRKQEAELKRLDSQIGRNFRNVGNYSSALKGAKTSLIGIAAGAGIATSATLIAGTVIANAVKGVIKFEKKNSELAGVLGTTSDEIKVLTEDAIRLGASTAKTALQVTELQISLSRLGFTQQEIINLAPAIVDGAIALNSELDETASLVGAVVRTFDDFSSLDASAIVDQLTLATQKSALNFKKLETGIPIVSGAANAAGISFTQMTALLGKLSDAGIDASMSATSLRNIFIDSAAQGLNFTEILERIKDSTDLLTAANDEFGRRTSVSATILAKNIDQVEDLDRALQDAGGTAKTTAEENLDNLSGASTRFTSAWSGMIQKLAEKDEIFGPALQKALENSAIIMNRFFDPFFGYTEMSEILAKGMENLGGQAKELTKDLVESRDGAEIEKGIVGLSNALGIATSKTEELRKVSKDSPEDFAAFGKASLLVGLISNEIEILKKGLKGAKLDWFALMQGIDDATTSAEEFDSIDLDEFIDDEFAMGAVKSHADMLRQLEIDELASLDKRYEKNAEALNKKAAADAKANDKAIDRSKKRAQAEAKIFAEERDAKILASAMALAQGIADSVTSVNDLRNAQIEQELQTVLNARDAEIAAANGNADEIAIIQEKFKKKTDELNLEKAKNDKQSAIFEAIINTAIGVTQALASANPILAAVVGALGAVQVGVIASTPLPAFEKGTDFAPGGAAIVGEKGTEMVVTPSGEISLTPNKASVVDLERGSTVLTAAETVAALSNFNDGARELTAPNVVVQGLTRGDLDKQTKALSEAFENQTQFITNLNQGSVETFVKKNGNKTKYYNNRYN